MLRVVVLVLLLVIDAAHQQTLFDGVIQFLRESQEQLNSEPRSQQRLYSEYDFIIVGAGTAGCVLANRLTENPKWSVLLIEAGGAESFLMDIPILANYLQFSQADWRYKTMPSERYCMGMENNQCNWPRGKVMGGSSVLNYMIYTRGNRRDYDSWALMGNDGWSYDEVLPYFKKIENFTIPEYANSTYHNSDGYLNVGYAPYHTKLADAIVQANEELGIKYVDYNGKTQTGVSLLQTTLKDGLRHSSNRAYLHPVRNRPNLHVRKEAQVMRVIIDEQTRTATGVELATGNRILQIAARKEVILSAGAINSPQLLMLSGIGPRKHLKQFGIPVISNLKVGYNLMDHIAVGGLTFVINPKYTLKTEDVVTEPHLIRFLNYHRGVLTIPGGCEALTFHDFKDPSSQDGYPDIELLYIAGSISSDQLLRKDFGIRDDMYNEIFKPIEDKNSFMIFPMLMRPKSKGRILLQSTNYRIKPLIYPNYFAHPQDAKTLVEGVKLSLNITQQAAMRKLGTRFHSIPLASCMQNGTEFGSDEYFECFARHFTFTIYHYSGTCKMGARNDRSAVVDARLRVHGVKHLRVIDASIMPEIVTGHTNAPTFMIAEKGADMIKEDWGYPTR